MARLAMIYKFSIDRPVLANVLAILFVLIGGVALWILPVAQYPNITPPTVQVSTRYPGASADTVLNTVALPIEQAVNGVDRMIYMQSTSTADGTYSLIVTFESAPSSTSRRCWCRTASPACLRSCRKQSRRKASPFSRNRPQSCKSLRSVRLMGATTAYSSATTRRATC